MTFVQRATSVVATLFCALSLSTVAHAAELPLVQPVSVAILPVVALPSATPHFATLADAVEAQIVGDASSRDLACLAVAIYREARGEPLPGQLAVANVILNRVRSGRFAGDACGVVTQRGQFSFVRGGQLPSVDTAQAAYRTALKLAQVASTELWDSPAPRALFFHAARVGMARGGMLVARIGHHIFYR